MAEADRFPRLERTQQRASDPSRSAWLSASAGTGKTQVITARVLRLLLAGVKPQSILCLTFTKAGAAEMAQRIQSRLASWVRMRDETLAEDLFALGEDVGPRTRQRARTLFAEILDAPGGGLRIETIHAFAQSLLAAFPVEAGVTPGFRPLDGREEVVLRHRVLGEMLETAEAGGDLGLIDDVAALSLRLGEDGAQSLMAEATRAPEALAALGPREGVEARLRRHLGLPAGDIEEAIVAGCADDAFDCAALARLAAANRLWGRDSGVAAADRIEAWLAASSADRAAGMHEIQALLRTQKGGIKAKAGQIAADADYEGLALRSSEALASLLAMRTGAATTALLAAAWRAGQAFSSAYADAKRSAGVVDFDDLIRSAQALLTTPGIGDWVRYKLDRTIDHILVDEAQDTNGRQWTIVEALAAEYYAGEGAVSRHRTIFTVGDYKQAIFGFQGTSPVAFEEARDRFTAHAEAAQQTIEALSLTSSYRSTPAILEVIDALIDRVGAARLGLSRQAEPHRSARGELPGRVILWPAVAAAEDDPPDDAEEGWIDNAARRFAERLARQIRSWIEEPLWLGARARPLRPEDILILVRRRGDLAALIVARLHAEGVAVAGVDRLRLSAPLAVRDLLAAIRFTLQPDDDLNLASLLVSPLFGWSQDELFQVAHGRGIASLWRALRDAELAPAGLGALLAMADFATPHEILESVLSGPIGGRRRLLERLGEEARDPVEELVNAALDFEGKGVPSLQRFVDWFDRDDVEIARDPSAPLDAVRVMTVHGAKGLQAPLVILADATVDPARTPARSLSLGIDEDLPVPIFRPRKDERFASLENTIATADAREREEHWRLLYVAATRAEEMLVVGGSLGPAMKGVPPEHSWYAAMAEVLAGLGAEKVDDRLWGPTLEHSDGTGRRPSTRSTLRPRLLAPQPEWLRRAAPREERPPRPLAPSSIGVDDVSDPPPGATQQAMARRGTLLHALFERLPPVPSEARAEVAAGWLLAQGVVEGKERDEIIASACAIIAEPAFAALFGDDALAEAPIAAIVNGVVVAGTADRLLVGDDAVQVVDFKTGRRVPATIANAPLHHLRQMAAYAAALAVVFPGRRIEAALLYTAEPRLLVCPPELLARHKPRLTAAEQSLSSES